MTRARDRLVLVTDPNPLVGSASQGGEFDAEAALTQDFWRGWIETKIRSERVAIQESLAEVNSGQVDVASRVMESACEFDSDVDPQCDSESASPSSLPNRLTRARHSVTEWLTLQRCPRAYEWNFIRPPRTSVEVATDPVAVAMASVSTAPLKSLFEGSTVTSFVAEVESVSEAPGDQIERMAASQLGTKVHRALEFRDWEALQQLEREVGSRRLSAHRIQKWAEHRLLEAGDETEVFSELDFEFRWEGETVVGSMDRVEVIWREGQPVEYRIIDFKVGDRAKAPVDLLEQYGLQMELYAFALSKLDPRSIDRTTATLAYLSPDQIVEVTVPLTDPSRLQSKIRAGLEIAREIWSGQLGLPQPSKACYACQFADRCEVALQKAVRA